MDWLDPFGLAVCSALKEKLQNVVDQTVADIKANPSLTKDLMSKGSYRHLHPNYIQTVLGKLWNEELAI